MRTVVFFLMVASLAFAQGKPVRIDEIGNRAAPFEKLQNDISTAVAHAARLTEEDRAKLDKANLVLGEAIADRREQHKLNKKKVLAVLKDIETVSAKCFSEPDRKLIAEDRKRAEVAAKEPTQVVYIYTGKPGQPI